MFWRLCRSSRPLYILRISYLFLIFALALVLEADSLIQTRITSKHNCCQRPEAQRTHTDLVDPLSAMRVTELKTILKGYGGKAGSLHKSELIGEIRKYSASALLASMTAGESPGVPRSDPADIKNKGNADHLASVAPRSISNSNRVGINPPQSVDIASGKFTVKSQPRVWTSSNTASSSSSGSSSSGGGTKPASFGRSQQQARASAAATAVESIDEYEEQLRHSQEQEQGQGEQLRRDEWSRNAGSPGHRDARLGTEVAGEMEITFLGTASCIPGLSRGVSCMALRYLRETWLFDCGESTQVQMRKSKVRPGKVSKIFITHAHGDHAFGLAGVLCMIGQGLAGDKTEGMSDEDWQEPIDIYGPQGIRDLVRAVVQLSYSRIVVPHRIHELKNVPYLHTGQAPRPPQVRTRFDPLYGERDGGRDIYPDEKGHYHLFSSQGVSVRAAPMVHTIPCVGFVVHEDDRPGALRPEVFNSLVLANKEALTAQYRAANQNPMYVYRDIKALKPDEAFTFPDGSVIYGRDVTSTPVTGRKVVYMGDTCSGEHIAELARDADVLIHEATNAYLPHDDSGRFQYSSYAQLEHEMRTRGHSTPQMAGRFAAQVGAKKLLLTHFSSRYNGDAGEQSMRIMWQFENMARAAYEQYFRRVARLSNAQSPPDNDTSRADHSINADIGVVDSSVNSATGLLSSAGGGGDKNKQDKQDQSGEGGVFQSQYRELGINDIIAAWDFMSLNIPRPDQVPRIGPKKVHHVDLHNIKE